jgi:hypothetical protein
MHFCAPYPRHMDELWPRVIALKYAGVLDQLERVVRERPDELWESSLWPVKRSHFGRGAEILRARVRWRRCVRRRVFGRS